jgi:hypothetical protein
VTESAAHSPRSGPVRFLRTLTDTALDAVSAAGLAQGQKTLAGMCASNRRNLLVTTVLNAVLLAVALTASFLTGNLQKVGIAAISATNLVMLIRTMVKVALFLKNTVRPWWFIIRFAAPCFLRNLVTLKSWSGATKATIRAVYRYMYQKKVPEGVKAFHPWASLFGLVKSVDDIEDKVVTDFYPLVKSYMIEVLVYNVALYSLAYWLFLLIVKNTIFVTMLGMTLPQVLFYPLTFLK